MKKKNKNQTVVYKSHKDVIARLVQEDCAGKHYSVHIAYSNSGFCVWLPCSTRENAMNLLKAIRDYAAD